MYAYRLQDGDMYIVKIRQEFYKKEGEEKNR